MTQRKSIEVRLNDQRKANKKLRATLRDVKIEHKTVVLEFENELATANEDFRSLQLDLDKSKMRVEGLERKVENYKTVCDARRDQIVQLQRIIQDQARATHQICEGILISLEGTYGSSILKGLSTAGEKG